MSLPLLKEQEEKILNFLTGHLDKDRSTFIKQAIFEKYEDLRDIKTIRKFERKEKAGKARFPRSLSDITVCSENSASILDCPP